jgi:hypothetical protein
MTWFVLVIAILLFTRHCEGLPEAIRIEVTSKRDTRYELRVTR